MSSDVAVDRVWLHAAQVAFAECPDQLNVISVLTGRITLDFGRRGTTENAAGQSYLYLPDSAADLAWDTFSALAIRLPMNVVARSTAELTDLHPEALRFLSPCPLSAAYGRLWSRTATMLWERLSAPDGVVENPLVYRELLNTVTAAAVTAFPNTATSRGYVPGPGDVRPAAVRRAIAYVDAHASLPITVTDIADAAGTTPRALRAGFARHLDTTPTAYLRRVRVQAAHRDLQDADPTSGVTVTEIAARWGFTNPARFKARYQQTFGVSPSHTLHT